MVKTNKRQFWVHFLVLLMVSSQSGQCQKQPSQPLTGLPLAETLVRQGGLEEARKILIADLQAYPSNVNDYNLLGIIDAQEKNYSGALAAFQYALSLEPNSTKTHNNLGDLYAAETKLDLAEREYRTVLRIDPRNRDGNYNLGVLLIAKGYSSSAIPYLQGVKPEDTSAELQLIDAYLKCRRMAEALQLAHRISEQHKESVSMHTSLGVLLASEKQYNAAQIELEKANALRPDNFEILYNIGLIFYQSGDINKAELALGRALKVHPDSLEGLYMLAKVYRDESRPLDALDLLVRARKSSPNNVDILYLMARISMSQYYFEDAIPLLESGLQIAPLRNDIRASLGESYFMAGKVDRAISEFQRLLEAEKSARANGYLGLSYTHLGRFEEAKRAFQNGILLDPKNIVCLFNLGFIAERQGDASGAAILFEKVLRLNPKYPEALLELANLRMASSHLTEAQRLLERYILVSHAPAAGYYKLAKVERSLHQDAASERSLKIFQTLSKDIVVGSYPYEHLFDYLDNRSALAPEARQQLDLSDLEREAERHPDQPEGILLLAEGYLKSGRFNEARATLSKLDSIGGNDYRTLIGIGVLLGRYHCYEEAINYFEKALYANPKSDETRFDLADALFKTRKFAEALDAAERVSPEGKKDDSYLALLGDIYAQLGSFAKAENIFRDEIARNPDGDQEYLSLSLLELREHRIKDARETLLKGRARISASGKILWGLGLTEALDGNTSKAEELLERAVDLMPEWAGGYSLLGLLYFETGHVEKAREVLGRFRNSSANGSLDAGRIERFLSLASATSTVADANLGTENKEQFLQLALSLVDRTL